jgi:translation initiation factor 5A
MNIDEGFLNLMTSEGTEKNDVKVPEGDLGKQIEADFEEGKELVVTVVSSMGEEAALGVKV